MAAKSERRSERIEVRLSPSLRDRITRAAALRGQTVAAFVTAAARDAAAKAIDDDEVTRLNAEDFDRLTRLLENPPEPNEALRDAATRYRATVRRST